MLFFSDARNLVRICSFGIAVICLLALFPRLSLADENKGNLPLEVQAALDKVLASKPGTSLDTSVFSPILDFTMSPLVYNGGKEVFPAKRDKEGQGIYEKRTIKAPLATVLRYLYDPKLPQEAVYPASLRSQKWLPGSDILTLEKGIWEHLDAGGNLALWGVEEESITPDTNTGSYYRYLSDRFLLLTEYEGRKVFVTLTWQKDRSDVGKKAAVIGDYQNWDFVYSGVPGMLKKGVGWADTFMYDSCAVVIFFENAPGGNNTEYAVFKWLRAGWANMNMVKRHHIRNGAERSFAGLNAFLSSPSRPQAADIVAYAESLKAMDEAALRAKFAPYAQKVAEAAATTKVLEEDDFKKIVSNGSYGDHLSKEELVSALLVNSVKEQLGKPVLVSSR